MLRDGAAPRFQCDIQHLPVKDNAVDIVFCLHVLEHVRHDKKAIGELCRALKPGGIAYIMVPVDLNRDKTEEWDEPAPDVCGHIWAYSPSDFKHKLDPFQYLEIKPADFLSPEEIRRFRIPDKEILYRCVKR
jgi:ubiquinone/menaquinone biosynthesis C-methylase UbiE